MLLLQRKIGYVNMKKTNVRVYDIKDTSHA